jgi:hypothetical protein
MWRICRAWVHKHFQNVLILETLPPMLSDQSQVGYEVVRFLFKLIGAQSRVGGIEE